MADWSINQIERGVRVNLDQIVLGDGSLSAREIWGAEYQENVCVLVKRENIPLLRDICARERIHFMEIGQVTGIIIYHYIILFEWWMW